MLGPKIHSDIHIILLVSDISLVGGLEHLDYDFPFSWECHRAPTDELTPSFFRGVGQPPTRSHQADPNI